MESSSVLNLYDRLPSDLQLYINSFFDGGVLDYHKIQMREIFSYHFQKIFFNNRFNFRNEFEEFIFNYIKNEDFDIYDTYENVIPYNERNHIVGCYYNYDEDYENSYEIDNQFGRREESEPPLGLSITHNRLNYTDINDVNCFKYLLTKYYKVLFYTDDELWDSFYVLFDYNHFKNHNYFDKIGKSILFEYFDFEANFKKDKRINKLNRMMREAVFRARDKLPIRVNRYFDLLNRHKNPIDIFEDGEINRRIDKLIWFAFCLVTEKYDLLIQVISPNCNNELLNFSEDFNESERIYKTESKLIKMNGTDLYVVIKKCNDRTFY
jgi:hypothetical protein